VDSKNIKLETPPHLLESPYSTSIRYISEGWGGAEPRDLYMILNLMTHLREYFTDDILIDPDLVLQMVHDLSVLLNKIEPNIQLGLKQWCVPLRNRA
jgi:hypothetical protein